MTRSCRGKPICMPGVPDDPRLQWSSLCTLDGFNRGVFKGDGHPPVVYLPNILEGVWKDGAGWPTANIMFPCTIFWPCCIWYDMFGKTLIHGQFQVENLKHPTHLSGFCAWFSVAYHIPVYKWSSIIMLQLDLAMVVIQSRRTYVASKSVGFSTCFFTKPPWGWYSNTPRSVPVYVEWWMAAAKTEGSPSDIQLSHNQPMIWVVCTAWVSHAKVGRTSISALCQCPWWGYLIWASRFLFYRLLCSLLFVWRGLLNFFWTPHQPQFSRAE